MNWTCPYCGHATTITSPNTDEEWEMIDIGATYLSFKTRLGFRYEAIACPNKECKKLFFRISLKKAEMDHLSNWRETKSIINSWQLLPESAAKPQPNYIPSQIVQDYTEACRIKDLSPKASATLSRRCLQGMIRSFWSISVKSGKLSDEINELETKVSQAEWDAIDAVRSVGNIGAHMEKDVNVIIDVEPNEAELLIQLIEDLLKDWYVTKHERDSRHAGLKALAQKKKAQKQSGPKAVPKN